MLKTTTNSVQTSDVHPSAIQAFAIKAVEIFIPLSVLGFILAMNFGLHFIPEVGYSISPIGCAGFCLLVGGIAVTSTAFISYVVAEKQLALYAIYPINEQSDKNHCSSYEQIEAYLHLGLSHVAQNSHLAHEVSFAPKPNIQAGDANHQTFASNHSNRFFSAAPRMAEHSGEKATFKPQL